MLGFRLFRSFATRAEIFPTIRTILIEKNNVPEDKINPNSTFSELGLDNFDSAELVMTLCIKFQIEMEPEHVEEIMEVQSIPQLKEFAEKRIPN